MDQNLNTQTIEAVAQPQASSKKTTFIIVGIVALAIALIMDFINERQTYISPYYFWMFGGSLIIYILQVYILVGFLKLFKITDTSFGSRIIFVGISSLAFDVMQYFFLPKIEKGDIIEFSIGLIVYLVILFSLSKNVFKIKIGKAIGLSLSFLVAAFLISLLLLFILSKIII